MMEFKDRLRDLMSERGIKTPEELSRKLGELNNNSNLHANTIRNYLKGNSPKDIGKYEILANYFNVTTDFLQGYSEVKTKNIDIKNFCDEYGLTEQSLDIIKSSVYANCSDIFNSFLYDFAIFDLTCKLKALISLNEMIKENLYFLLELRFFEEYIATNQNNNQIIDFLKIFENKISNIKEYNSLCIKKSNSLKIYSFLWSYNLPTLQKEETTIIELFEDIKNSIKNNSDKKIIYKAINDFTIYIANVLSDFKSKRELMKYHFIKSITNSLDKVIPEENGALYYKELDEYYEYNSYFTKEELSRIKKEHKKSDKIIDTELNKL